MSYDNYMYAVDRSDEYLAHYGIKGMKWGVQKAREVMLRDKQAGGRKLDRQYLKAQKKLEKLRARAANGSKYAKRAAALGAGAALAGGVAVEGATGMGQSIIKAGSGIARSSPTIGRGIRRAGQLISKIPGLKNQGTQIARAGRKIEHNGSARITEAGANIRAAGDNLRRWGNSNSVGQALSGTADKISSISKDAGNKVSSLKGVSNNTITRVGAGALGAGLAAGAAYNAYRAATTKRAARKAQAFESEMNKAFAGTKYGRNRKRRH